MILTRRKLLQRPTGWLARLLAVRREPYSHSATSHDALALDMGAYIVPGLPEMRQGRRTPPRGVERETSIGGQPVLRLVQLLPQRCLVAWVAYPLNRFLWYLECFLRPSCLEISEFVATPDDLRVIAASSVLIADDQR